MALDELEWERTDKHQHEVWTDKEYKVLHDGSGGGSFSRDTAQAPVAYLCEYAHVEKFLEAVLGRTVRTPAGDGFSLVRSAPLGSLPQEHPWFWNFFASSAEVVPVGTPAEDEDTGGPVWKKAVVTVVFRPPGYRVVADADMVTQMEWERFTGVTTEVSAEYLTLAGSGLQFVARKAVLDFPPGQPVPHVRKRFTWQQIPAAVTDSGRLDLATPPKEFAAKKLLGPVNSDEFIGERPGAVLFTGYEPRLVVPSVAAAGRYYWDVAYVFAVRDTGGTSPYGGDEAVGWNYVYDPLKPDGPGWDPVTDDGTAAGRRLYQARPFAQLFNANY